MKNLPLVAALTMAGWTSLTSDFPSESTLNCIKEVSDRYVTPSSIVLSLSPDGIVDEDR